MEILIKKLNYHFWVSIIVLGALFLLVLTRQINFADYLNVGVVAERYSIGLTLVAIPIALKLFADTIKKHFNNSTPELAIKVYSKSSLLRLYIINTMALVNIILLAMSNNSNFIWLTVVLFVVYIFCKPSYDELLSLTIKKKEDDEDE